MFSGAHLHVGGGPEVEEAADGLGAAGPGSQVQRGVPCTVQSNICIISDDLLTNPADDLSIIPVNDLTKAPPQPT